MRNIDREIRLLEFDKIRIKISRYACSPWGAERAKTVLPYTDYTRVEEALKETTDACAIIKEKGSPLSVVQENTTILLRAEKEGVLQGEELRIIGDFLEALQKLKRFFKKETYDLPVSNLPAYVARIDPLPALLQVIEHCVDEDGQIKDTASSTLSVLRRKKTRLQERIHDRMEKYLRDPSVQKYLQESLVTIRKERFVLPVKQEYRKSIPGIIHDQSASGATIFVEPVQVVAMHNELQKLNQEEEKEIEKILREVSAAVNREVFSLRQSVELYAHIDFTFSKGHYSLELGGFEPELNEQGFLNIVQGRHPLLDQEAVPIDFYIGDAFRTLVITGPNTGGKTVTLKTIGLFVLMTQCGIHVPASSGTQFPLFNGVYADIGDEQNIEQSLSTFSGHLKNIIQILDDADENSLVLLDELGAGTDPSEGAALAMSLLEAFHKRKVITVATTHFNELKVFTHIQQGMENASVEFDPETLSPTYRLFIGVPGSSNAFAIAERLGLDKSLIQRAKSFLSTEELNVEQMMVSLAEKERSLHKDNRAAKDLRRELEYNKKELEEEKAKLRQKKSQILDKAREEARHIVRSTKKTMDDLLRELHRMRQQGTAEALKEAEGIREKIHRFREELEPSPPGSYDSEQGRLCAKDLAPGLNVYIKSLRQKGEILSFVSNKEIQVQVGAMRITTTLDDLEKVSADANTKISRESGGGTLVFRKKNVRTSLDLRGKNVEEAIQELDRYLDEAYLGGLPSATIIHGKGTGKLREGLHEFIKEHDLVKNYRLGERDEGGEGVTIVSFE